MLELSDRERATLLAALRFWQQGPTDLGDNHSVGLRSTHFEEHEPLSAVEIDELCERLNSGEPVADSVTTQYVLYDFDQKKLLTTQIFEDEASAAEFSWQLNNVLIVPLHVFADTEEDDWGDGEEDNSGSEE